MAGQQAKSACCYCGRHPTMLLAASPVLPVFARLCFKQCASLERSRCGHLIYQTSGWVSRGVANSHKTAVQHTTLEMSSTAVGCAGQCEQAKGCECRQEAGNMDIFRIALEQRQVRSLRFTMLSRQQIAHGIEIRRPRTRRCAGIQPRFLQRLQHVHTHMYEAVAGCAFICNAASSCCSPALSIAC